MSYASVYHGGLYRRVRRLQRRRRSAAAVHANACAFRHPGPDYLGSVHSRHYTNEAWARRWLRYFNGARRAGAS